MITLGKDFMIRSKKENSKEEEEISHMMDIRSKRSNRGKIGEMIIYQALIRICLRSIRKLMRKENRSKILIQNLSKTNFRSKTKIEIRIPSQFKMTITVLNKGESSQKNLNNQDLTLLERCQENTSKITTTEEENKTSIISTFEKKRNLKKRKQLRNTFKKEEYHMKENRISYNNTVNKY